MGINNFPAMVLPEAGSALELEHRPMPKPKADELLVAVTACGVCRTDLHVVDGDLPDLHRAVVPGHEIVGRVAAIGQGVKNFSPGQRVGVPWLGWTCGECEYCQEGKENLCLNHEFTGYSRDGGYAGYVLADHRYCFSIHGDYSDAEAAPLLCAGLIGYRSLKMTGDARHLGIYGFGAAAHIVTQVANYQNRDTLLLSGRAIKRQRTLPLKWGPPGPAGQHSDHLSSLTHR
jgi:propanol-preferring alcohol dehydrogenase